MLIVVALEVQERGSFMAIEDLKKEDFENLPHRKWDEEIICDSIVIIPMDYVHDSGFLCMDVIAIIDEKPVFRCSGCSDVIHIDGIGGYGLSIYDSVECMKRIKSRMKPVTAWSIDFLPCGYMRLFHSGKIKIAPALSSLEIFAVDN